MTLQDPVPKRPCPFQESLYTQPGCGVASLDRVYTTYRAWIAPSRHAWATGRQVANIQPPVSRALTSSPDRSPDSDRTTKSKDFGFQGRQQRPLEKWGGPCMHLTFINKVGYTHRCQGWVPQSCLDRCTPDVFRIGSQGRGP